jgi:hypothetical protein
MQLQLKRWFVPICKRYVRSMLLIPNGAERPASPSAIHYGIEESAQQYDVPMP